MNLVAQLLYFQLLGEVLIDAVEPHANLVIFQQLLFLFGGKRRQRRGDEIHQAARLFDVHGDGLEFVGERGRGGDNLLEQREHIALQRLNLGSFLAGRLRYDLHARTQKRRKLRVFAKLHPLQALGKNEQTLVGHLHNFVHRGQRAHAEKIGRGGGVNASLALRDDNNGLVFTQRIDQLNRAFPANGKRQHGMRKQHRVTHRQHRQLRRGRRSGLGRAFGIARGFCHGSVVNG